MRLLMYEDETGRHLGALQGEDVVLLGARLGKDGDVALPDDMLRLIDLGADGVQRARSLLRSRSEDTSFVRPLRSVTLLPPLNPPRGNVVCIGRNYREHVEEESRVREQEIPPLTVFTKAQTSINGPYGDVPIDATITAQVDWEVELGVVIGRRGLNIPREHAMDYVFGYTVLNDLSARDVQFSWGGQFFKGKSLDGFCPLGPWIVTPDEIADPQNLGLVLRVNGEIKQQDSTRNMIYPIDDLIARLSAGMTLVPGTLIASGTPSGVGMARTPPQFLQPGDIMETEVEGIGVLRNRMVSVS